MASLAPPLILIRLLVELSLNAQRPGEEMSITSLSAQRPSAQPSLSAQHPRADMCKRPTSWCVSALCASTMHRCICWRQRASNNRGTSGRQDTPTKDREVCGVVEQHTRLKVPPYSRLVKRTVRYAWLPDQHLCSCCPFCRHVRQAISKLTKASGYTSIITKQKMCGFQISESKSRPTPHLLPFFFFSIFWKHGGREFLSGISSLVPRTDLSILHGM